MNAPTVAPIDSSQKTKVIGRTNQLVGEAVTMFEIPLRPILVRFDLRGHSAGMFRVRDLQPEIRYNPWIFARYFESNMAQTVPHEVAHYVVYHLFGRHGVKPHGKEWRKVMLAFGCAPRTTCDYDLRGIPVRRIKRYNYRCKCSDHQVSSIRHNRMIKYHIQYLCRVCGQPLKRQHPSNL